MHLKRWVLSLARNCSRLMVKERRWSGKEFQILGAATRKLHLPSSDLVVGTYKSPQCAERRPTLPLTSVSGVQYKLSMLHSSGKRFGFTDYQHANFIGKKCQKCERYCGKPIQAPFGRGNITVKPTQNIITRLYSDSANLHQGIYPQLRVIWHSNPDFWIWMSAG